MFDKYFEMKKRNNLILTEHNLDPKEDYQSVRKASKPVTSKEGLSYWDRSLGRYRTYEEQRAAVKKLAATADDSVKNRAKTHGDLIERRVSLPEKAWKDEDLVCAFMKLFCSGDECA